ncbi:chemotaxis-specific protein-glutamate methyltransferase CheB [Massilia sp. 9096]|uniref:chemotaxis-specific protein-glutamate methyltransferase CheB n=1 Tax=Massilia sp. 9096 TaxID=1500894 RepID=UPI00055D2438|nr:chemotaxis-specific protein-glutamate methyltransferase CheB [Massilia sp. 9096]
MKIGIANDSAMAAEALRRVIAASEHQVAWIARNGRDAVRLCADLPPDLVLMDLAMPVLDGIEATRQIMRAHPCAILIVTANPQDQPGQVFRALGAGALDVTATPVLLGQADGAAALLAKIRTIGKLVAGAAAHAGAATAGAAAAAAAPTGPLKRLVAIGASTGGPVVLARLLSRWRPPPDTAAVVVQHIDAAFAGRLAQWLDGQAISPVRPICDGDALEGGVVQLARTNDHLRLAPGQRLHYDAHPRDAVYRPSIDVFFDSVARHWERDAIGILLTGMGRDGAAGLLALRRAGKATIAQDQASCAVYGMPRAAAELGAAERILAPDAIAAVLPGASAASGASSILRTDD